MALLQMSCASARPEPQMEGPLDGDLTRIRSQGHLPSVVFAAPGKASKHRPGGAIAVAVDWKSKPSVPLKYAEMEALRPYLDADYRRPGPCCAQNGAE